MRLFTRTLQKPSLSLALGILATSALAQVTAGWSGYYDAGFAKNNYPIAFQLDAQDNVYIFSSSAYGGSLYWVLRKEDPYGTLIWQRNVKMPATSVPRGLTRDSIGDSYIGGDYTDASNHTQIEVIKISNAGAFLYSKALTSQDGQSLLALTTDSNNNWYVAAETWKAGQQDLDTLEFNLSGGGVHSTDAANIQPLAATYDSAGNLLVTGNEPSGNGAAAAMFTLSGVCAWIRTAETVVNGTATTKHTFNLFPGISPGTSYLADTAYTTPADTYAFQVQSLKTTGAPAWTTAAKEGFVSSISAGSTNDVYVFFQSLSSTNYVPTIERLEYNGFQAFSKQEAGFGSGNNMTIAADGTAGCWLTYAVANNTADHHLVKLTPTGVVSTDVAMEVPYAGGLAFAQPIKSLFSQGGGVWFFGGIFLNNYFGISTGQFVEGLALSSISIPSTNGGTSGMGTVTLNGPAGSTGFDVQVSTPAGQTVLTLSSSVITVHVPANQTSADFSFSTTDPAQNTTATVIAKAKGVLRQGNNTVLHQ